MLHPALVGGCAISRTTEFPSTPKKLMIHRVSSSTIKVLMLPNLTSRMPPSPKAIDRLEAIHPCSQNWPLNQRLDLDPVSSNHLTNQLSFVVSLESRHRSNATLLGYRLPHKQNYSSPLGVSYSETFMATFALFHCLFLWQWNSMMMAYRNPLCWVQQHFSLQGQ